MLFEKCSFPTVKRWRCSQSLIRQSQTPTSIITFSDCHAKWTTSIIYEVAEDQSPHVRYYSRIMDYSVDVHRTRALLGGQLILITPGTEVTAKPDIEPWRFVSPSPTIWMLSVHYDPKDRPVPVVDVVDATTRKVPEQLPIRKSRVSSDSARIIGTPHMRLISRTDRTVRRYPAHLRPFVTLCGIKKSYRGLRLRQNKDTMQHPGLVYHKRISSTQLTTAEQIYTLARTRSGFGSFHYVTFGHVMRQH